MNPELMKMMKNAKNKYSRSGKTIKLKEGKTVLHILGKPGQKFWFEAGVHWIKTEKGGSPVAVVGCREEVYGEPCEICNAIQRAAASATDDTTLALIKDWNKKRSVLVNALILSGPDKSDEPQVLELTPTTFSSIIGQLEEYAGADINIMDPTKGLPFIIERKGKDLNTEYSVMPSPKPMPYDPKLLDRLIDLEKFFEENFFKGDEPKALRAIGAVTGLAFSTSSASALSKPSTTPALTGPTGRVADADEEDLLAKLETGKTPEKVEASTATTAPATAADDDEIAKMLADIEGKAA